MDNKRSDEEFHQAHRLALKVLFRDHTGRWPSSVEMLDGWLRENPTLPNVIIGTDPFGFLKERGIDPDDFMDNTSIRAGRKR
jgi:hypothetical protein